MEDGSDGRLAYFPVERMVMRHGAQFGRAGYSFDEGQRSISKAESDVGLVLMNLPAEAFAQYRLFTACISRR